MMDKNSKVLVIALDGATLDLIQPWAENGELPTLKRLIQNGVSGPLLSTYPPLTGPAWSSFMTGKSPGNHGILEFFRRQPGAYRQTLNQRYDIDGKSLWRILSEAGKAVGVMGIPLTYPPEPVNGFIITGLLTPSGVRDFIYPRQLLDELEEQLGTYRIRHDEKYHKSNPKPFLKEQNEILENNTQAALYLMKNKPWDFFMVHYLGPDRIQHEFWHLLDPNHPQHDPVERAQLGNVVLDLFKKIDASIDQLLNASNGANVILMSDHGFGPIVKFVNMNTWLIEQGFLVLKRSMGTRFRTLLFRLGFNYSVLSKIVLKLGFGKRAVQLGRAKREDLQRQLFLSLEDIDWKKSSIYSIGNFGQLYVNLKGREPQGFVNPGEEYEAVLEKLTQSLRSFVDPETGQPVVDRIYRRDEIYHGAYADRAPDLVFYTRNMEYKAMGLSDFSSPRVLDPPYGTTGHHRMNGILICYGPQVFKEGIEFNDARIQDLAPTILYLMGQKIPRDMDGEILLDLFAPAFRSKREITFIDAAESVSDEIREELTDEEQAELTSRMRDLGYVT